jgi:hypothetical protein
MRLKDMIEAPITLLRHHAKSLDLDLAKIRSVGLSITPQMDPIPFSRTSIAYRSTTVLRDPRFCRQKNGLYDTSGDLPAGRMRAWYQNLEAALATAGLESIEITASAAAVSQTTGAALRATALHDLAVLILDAARAKSGEIDNEIVLTIDRHCLPAWSWFAAPRRTSTGPWVRRWFEENQAWTAGLEKIGFSFQIPKPESSHAMLATRAQATAIKAGFGKTAPVPQTAPAPRDAAS